MLNTNPENKMRNNNVLIRHAKQADLPEMKKLFVETIETVCRNDYSPEQIAAWTSSIENTKRWTDKLMRQYFLIAETGNKIVGYTSLENHDYLDFLYVHKDYQRQGIANTLFTEIEAEAIKRGATRLTSDVSLTARAFFEHKGFSILKEQKNNIKGIEIINYKMIKRLKL